MATKSKTSIAQKPQADVNSSKLKEENANLKNQLKEMMDNYKEMQLQLQTMLIAQQNQNVPTTNDEDIVIGCRIYNGATLSSIAGDIVIPVGYHEEIEVKATELREVFKSPFGYKHMFRKGMLYFKDETNYKRFSINPEIDLSEEGLVSLLENTDEASLIEHVKNITKDKKDLMEVFALIYQIAYLIDKRKVTLDYEVRHALEKYFNIDFKDLINNFYQ